ncbi:MAG: class I SAM-dependent methyltransferase [Chloroflexi bacterium]|nr:MAG: class I SAM-dependent methyltransferase [Chloroflexota bacterium]MBL1192847.1 class I SAM-dependent methyltransferase [Chloroflexota bacterium]NOH10140.1 class I SAM-dependent methyltransferase [Chloroflexota bacterium]
MSMSSAEYHAMHTAEDRHWWFRALHRYLQRFLPDIRGLALDIGCGTGAWLQQLDDLGYNTHGLDVSHLATTLTHERGLPFVTTASANQLPYRSGTFDLVTSVDILEVEPVDPQQAVNEGLRVLKSGGYGLFVMAAHQWLLSEHDRAVGSVRRYNLGQMRKLFADQDVVIKNATYLFASTFPMTAIYKLINRPQADNNQNEAVSDVSVPHPLVNMTLSAVTAPETILHPHIPLPIGTSVCVLVQKKL